MNAHERVIKTLNHEEPDRIPLFNQVIMSGMKKKLLEFWGETYKREQKYIIFNRDFNLERKLGLDCAWGAGGLPVRLPKDILKNNPLPKLNNRDYYVDIAGRIHKKDNADAAYY